ncbi:MAG TPA: hypothetical protein ENL03_04490, partial [Phycisphaerae bacterium]|nr:hypothetical protein [Phycisphaerae bacterium]
MADEINDGDYSWKKDSGIIALGNMIKIRLSQMANYSRMGNSQAVQQYRDMLKPLMTNLTQACLAEPERHMNQLQQLAVDYMSLGNRDKSLEICDALEQRFASEAAACRFRANLMMMAGDNEEAARYLRKGITLQPSNMKTSIQLVRLYEHLGQPLQALKVLDEMRTVEGDLPLDSLEERALFFNRRGLRAQAAEVLEQVENNRVQQSPFIQLQLGRNYARLEYDDLAHKILSQIPDHSAYFLSGQIEIIRLCDTYDEKLENITLLKNSLNDPDPAREGVMVLEMEIHEEQDELDKALQVFMTYKGKYLGPNDILSTPAAHKVVSILVKAGKIDEAMEQAKKMAISTEATGWREIAALLAMRISPKMTRSILLPVDKTISPIEIVIGICASSALDNANELAKWTTRYDKLYQGRRSVLEILLVNIIAGKIPETNKDVTDANSGGPVGRMPREELLNFARKNPKKAASEAINLLCAGYSGRLGLQSLAKNWAMDSLNARGESQLSAHMVSAIDKTPETLKEILKLHTSETSITRLGIQAELYTAQDDFPKAAAILAKAAKVANGDPGLLFRQAMALERSDKTRPQALAIYEDVWRKVAVPAAANN